MIEKGVGRPFAVFRSMNSLNISYITPICNAQTLTGSTRWQSPYMGYKQTSVEATEIVTELEKSFASRSTTAACPELARRLMEARPASAADRQTAIKLFSANHNALWHRTKAPQPGLLLRLPTPSVGPTSSRSALLAIALLRVS